MPFPEELVVVEPAILGIRGRVLVAEGTGMPEVHLRGLLQLLDPPGPDEAPQTDHPVFLKVTHVGRRYNRPRPALALN